MQKLFLKILSPIVVLFVFLFVATIRGDFPNMREKLLKVPLVSWLIQDHMATERKGQVGELKVINPSFKYLVNLMLGRKQADPDKIRPYMEYYSKVIELYPREGVAYMFLSFFHYHLQEYDSAQLTLLKAEELMPNNFWVAYNSGVLNLRQKDITQALKSFDHAVRVMQNVPAGEIYKSPFYQQVFLQVSDISNEILLQSIRDHIMNSYIVLIHLSYLEKKYQNMITYAKEVVDSPFDQKHLFLFYLGVAHFEQEKFSDALLFFNQSIKLQNNFGPSHKSIVDCLQKLSREEEAQKYFQTHQKSIESTGDYHWHKLKLSPRLF